jgi:hypothetical protein
MEYPKFNSTIAPKIATRLEEEATNRELTTSELVREIVTTHYEKSLAPQGGSGESMSAAKNGGDAEGRFQRHWPSGRPRRMMREMGESCERCGRHGEPCSIRDPTIAGKWKTLNLCDQCQRAIRKMDARAGKWFRRYCAPRNPATSIFKQPVTR